MNVPATDGVPLMVTTLPAHAPVTPVGKPANVAPVAPVVAYVIGVIAVLIQSVCAFVPAAEVSKMVLLGFTNTFIETVSPTQPLPFVSITYSFAVPALVQFTVIKFEGAPDIVPLPPAIEVIPQL